MTRLRVVRTVVIALASLGAGLVGLSLGASSPVIASDLPAVRGVPLVTHPDHGSPYRAARPVGVLVTRGAPGCLYLKVDGSPFSFLLVWPTSFRAMTAADGSIRVANGAGKVVAISERRLAVTGGIPNLSPKTACAGASRAFELDFAQILLVPRAVPLVTHPDDRPPYRAGRAVGALLNRGPAGCLYLKPDGSSDSFLLVWPKSFRAGTRPDGSIRVTNIAGNVAAVTGYRLAVTGGAPKLKPKTACAGADRAFEVDDSQVRHNL